MRLGALALAATLALAACSDPRPTEPDAETAVFLAIADSCPPVNGIAERFRFMTRDPQVIAQSTARIGNPEEIWVTGVFRTGDGGFNAPWHWHHDPDSVELAEVTIEACQGCPSLVETNLDYWTNFGRYCAPGRIIARES